MLAQGLNARLTAVEAERREGRRQIEADAVKLQGLETEVAGLRGLLDQQRSTTETAQASLKVRRLVPISSMPVRRSAALFVPRWAPCCWGGS